MGIAEDLAKILSSRYGKDVRQSIHDAIYDINDIAEQAESDASTAKDSAMASAESASASATSASASEAKAKEYKDEAFSGTPEGYETLVGDVSTLKEKFRH